MDEVISGEVAGVFANAGGALKEILSRAGQRIGTAALEGDLDTAKTLIDDVQPVRNLQRAFSKLALDWVELPMDTGKLPVGASATPPSQRKSEKRDFAELMIMEELQAGKMRLTELCSKGPSLGISSETVRKAAHNMGCIITGNRMNRHAELPPELIEKAPEPVRKSVVPHPYSLEGEILAALHGGGGLPNF